MSYRKATATATAPKKVKRAKFVRWPNVKIVFDSTIFAGKPVQLACVMVRVCVCLCEVLKCISLTAS